jgi:predicted RNA-binding protein YlqC (UPF0109 family)
MAGRGEVEAYRILLLIVHHLADNPDEVKIEIVRGLCNTTLCIKADQRDTSFLIGRDGRTADSIRVILAGIGRKAHWPYHLEIEGRSRIL